MNAPQGRPLTGSRLVDSVSYRWLMPVRSAGAVIHLAPRDGSTYGEPPRALCGEQAPRTERGTPRWRVHAAGGKVCGTCHAASCAEPTRIDWS